VCAIATQEKERQDKQLIQGHKQVHSEAGAAFGANGMIFIINEMNFIINR
jgi:hypothetical protein